MASKGNGTNWAYIIAGSALFFSVASTVIGQVSGGTEKLEKRVGAIEDALNWKYVSKEFAAKDFVLIDRALTDLKISKVDRDVWEMKTTSTDRQLTILRDHIKDIERANNQTFNTRDAFAALQSRLLELERAVRK